MANSTGITSISLTDLGSGITPNAINNVGQVVGQEASGQAFLWQNGTMTPLGTLGGTQSVANDINDSGVVVGWANDGTEKQKAFKWNGAMTSLDSVSSTASVAQAINGAGDVVGWRQVSTSYRSIVWYGDAGGGPLFGSANSQALGINANREIVGLQRDSLGQITDGYYWDGTGGGSSWTTGFGDYEPWAGINNSGLSGGEEGGFASYWQVGDGVNGIAKLNPADVSSLVCGLNDQSLLVGYSGNRAFLFDVSGQSLVGLSEYLPAGSAFSELTVANDINDSGMFVGVGLVSGVEHGFVGRIFVPEPGGIVLSGVCAVWLITSLRHFTKGPDS